MRRRRKIKSDKKLILFFILLALIFFVIGYSYLDKALINFFNTNQEIYVDRIIDGDTIEAGNISIRLLGINTPERGEFLYEEAKSFLGTEILNKNVTLEFTGDRYDKYNRLLAYIFFNNTNINEKLVENGFANYYFYSGKDKHSNELLEAWNKCLQNKINLCEQSTDKCGSCVNINHNGVSIINSCSFTCDISGWQVRGEGREEFIFNTTLRAGEKTGFALDLRNTGGSLFLRDDEGKLVEWKNEEFLN